VNTHRNDKQTKHTYLQTHTDPATATYTHRQNNIHRHTQTNLQTDTHTHTDTIYTQTDMQSQNRVNPNLRTPLGRFDVLPGTIRFAPASRCAIVLWQVWRLYTMFTLYTLHGLSPIHTFQLIHITWNNSTRPCFSLRNCSLAREATVWSPMLDRNSTG